MKHASSNQYEEAVKLLVEFRRSEEQRLNESIRDYLVSIRSPAFLRQNAEADKRYLAGIDACIERVRHECGSGVRI